MQTVHDALVNTLSIPDWDRHQRIYELDPSEFETHPDRTNKFCIIDLTIFPGRDKALKGRMITEINDLLGQRLGIEPADIFIVIHEPPLENWGIRGTQRSEA